jgi:hypothetical protein
MEKDILILLCNFQSQVRLVGIATRLVNRLQREGNTLIQVYSALRLSTVE